ncbi:MAG: HU family DNA-binding protein, partial [Syntrophales bacterium]
KSEKELLVTCQTGGGFGYSNLTGGIVMTKAELVSKLAEETKLTKKVTAAILDSFVKTLQAGLKKGVKIRIDGLGTFAVADRKARTGVNPQTRAKIKIPATKATVFRAAKALKDAAKANLPQQRKSKIVDGIERGVVKRYSFVVNDRYTQETVFDGEVEARDDDEAYETARSHIRDKDILTGLRKGNLILAIQYDQ